MTRKTIIWTIAVTAIAGTGFWLWWRQKDAVPASAVPVLQQGRMTLGGAQPTSSTTTVTPAAPGPSATDSIIAGIIPGYIPLPTIIA